MHIAAVAGAIVALFAAAPASSSDGRMNLFVSYYYAGEAAYAGARFDWAETLLMQARDEMEPGWRMAETLDALGRVYTALGRYEEAETCLLQALCMKERHLGPDSRPVPQTLNNLGDLHYIAGEHGLVEGYYRRALEINERDPLSVETARALNGMALLHFERGETVEAEKLLVRASGQHNRGGRRYHPYHATALVNLATLYTGAGRLSEAARALELARFIHEAQLRPDHPDAGVRLHAEARLYAAQGRFAAAREARQQAVDILERAAVELEEATPALNDFEVAPDGA